MKVSIVIPVYGVERRVERCIRSVLEQTHELMEVIVVNDCTPDGSMRVIEKVMEDYPARKPQVRLIDMPRNSGSAAARKCGMELATGDYVIHVDGDDYVDADFISKMASCACKTQSDVVMCDIVKHDANGTTHVMRNKTCASAHEYMASVIDGSLHGSLCNKLIKRSLYAEHTIFPTEGMNMFDDKSVVFRVLYYAQKVTPIADALYHYDCTQESSQTKGDKRLELEACKKLLNLMDDFFESHTIDASAQQALLRYKAIVQGLYLLYGAEGDMQGLKTPIPKIPLRLLVHNERMPATYAWAVIVHQLGLPTRWFSHSYRWLRKKIK